MFDEQNYLEMTLRGHFGGLNKPTGAETSPFSQWDGLPKLSFL